MITCEQRNEQLRIIADQTQELLAQGQKGESVMLTTITCPCGWVRTIRRAVRCLYCDIWFCETCAEEHFGQTREEYRKNHPIQEPTP